MLSKWLSKSSILEAISFVRNVLKTNYQDIFLRILYNSLTRNIN